MTEPTDAELWQLYMQQPGQHKDPIDFARAALAKWGTPATVELEADLAKLTERGAVAWKGIDAQELREGRWYMVNKDGMATLCADQADAEQSAKDAQALWPHMGPHRAAQLVEAGHASAAANAGSEPVAIRPDIQAVLAMLDVPVIARMSSHEGKLLKPGQEPPAFESAVPLVREWDHRRACETIIAALSRNN